MTINHGLRKHSQMTWHQIGCENEEQVFESVYANWRNTARRSMNRVLMQTKPPRLTHTHTQSHTDTIDKYEHLFNHKIAKTKSRRWENAGNTTMRSMRNLWKHHSFAFDADEMFCPHTIQREPASEYSRSPLHIKTRRLTNSPTNNIQTEPTYNSSLTFLTKQNRAEMKEPRFI